MARRKIAFTKVREDITEIRHNLIRIVKEDYFPGYNTDKYVTLKKAYEKVHANCRPEGQAKEHSFVQWL